ncbi:MAG TPA: GNAT family protein [Polyangiaceae bacterium]|nr:GNAT family protein [Polyangiaceae bacterium]
MVRHNEWGQAIGPELPGFIVPPPPPRAPMQGDYVELEPLDPERHAPSLWAALEPLLPSHWTYLPYGPFASYADFRAWLAHECTHDDPLFVAVVDRPTRDVIGLASYLRIQRAAACIEVGHLNFSARLARRPGATEAMAVMMRRAFELGYRRYEWKCDALNGPSRAAALRLGFQFEGLFRQATLYKGRSRDTAWYSVIDREWPGLDRAYRAWLAPDNFDAEGKQRSRLTELIQRERR